MGIVLITYDLKQPSRDYTDLFKAIQSTAAPGWCHSVESVWLIQCDKPCATIRDYLQKFVRQEDKLFVVRCGNAWASHGLGTQINQWLIDSLA